MATYVPELGGYMVDVPKVHFTNCDSSSDRVWFFDELTAASFSPSQENIEINAGWSKYPIALIQSGAALEASFTSAKFSMALFEMAHNEATSTAADIARPKTIRVDVTSDAGTFTDAKADVTKVYVNGLELVGPAVTPLTKGKFHATLNGGTGVVTLDFFADDVTDGTTIDLTYYTAAESGTQLTIPTEGASARGELTFTYPVYSSGIDCEDASLLGELIIVIYKARVTTAPGFDSSLDFRFPAQKCA